MLTLRLTLVVSLLVIPHSARAELSDLQKSILGVLARPETRVFADGSDLVLTNERTEIRISSTKAEVRLKSSLPSRPGVRGLFTLNPERSFVPIARRAPGNGLGQQLADMFSAGQMNYRIDKGPIGFGVAVQPTKIAFAGDNGLLLTIDPSGRVERRIRQRGKLGFDLGESSSSGRSASPKKTAPPQTPGGQKQGIGFIPHERIQDDERYFPPHPPTYAVSPFRIPSEIEPENDLLVTAKHGLPVAKAGKGPFGQVGHSIQCMLRGAGLKASTTTPRSLTTRTRNLIQKLHR